MLRFIYLIFFFLLVLFDFGEILAEKSYKYFNQKALSMRNAKYSKKSSLDFHENFVKNIMENCKKKSKEIEIGVKCEKIDFCKLNFSDFEEYDEFDLIKFCKCCLEDFSKNQTKSEFNSNNYAKLRKDLESSVQYQNILNQIKPLFNKIHEKYLINSSNIVYFHRDTKFPYLNLNFPVTISLPDVPDLRVNKIDSYILVLSEGNFKEELQEIVSLPSWSPRAKIILICSADLETLFKLVIYHYIYNVIILKTEKTIKIYTNFPFVEENVNLPTINPVEVVSDLFPNKLPLLWRNSTLVVSHALVYPYVICALCGTGTDVDVAKLLSERMKFHLIFDKTVYENWGGKQPNGTYDGAIDCLRTRDSDFVIGYFHLRDPVHMIDFEYTFSYMDDDVLWSLPRDEPLSHWSNLIHIFNKTSWIILLTTLVSLSLFWLYFGKTSKTEISYFRSNYVVELPFMLILIMSIQSFPKTFKLRVLYVTTWLFCFNIATIWNTYLFYYLTHDTYANGVTTTEDLVKTNLLLGIHPELAEMYMESGTEIGRYIAETYYPCDAGFSCMDRSAAKKDMATITSKRMYKYVLPSRYKVNGKNTIDLLEDVIIKDYVVLFLQKGHPLFESMDRLLIQLCSAGFIQHIDNMQDFNNELLHRALLSDSELFSVKALGVVHIQGTFYLLGFGLTISSVVLVLELYYFYMLCNKDKINGLKFRRNTKRLSHLDIFKDT